MVHPRRQLRRGVAISPIALLSLLALGQGASLKPLVVCVANHRPADDALAQIDRAEARGNELKRLDYVTQEFPKFVLAMPKDLLGTEEARRQSALFRSLAARASAPGGGIVVASDLAPEQEKTLRAIVAGETERATTPYASVSGLKLQLATFGLFTMKVGEHSIDVPMLPAPLDQAKEDEALMQPIPRSTVPKPPASSGDAPKGVRYVKRLTYVTPEGIDGVDAMDWIAQAQAELLKQARTAKADWQAASAALRTMLDAGTNARFNPGSNPRDRRFSDLTPESQFQVKQWFDATNRRGLDGLSAKDWLQRADTVDFKVQTTFELRLAESDGTGIFYIMPTCPVSP